MENDVSAFKNVSHISVMNFFTMSEMMAKMRRFSVWCYSGGKEVTLSEWFYTEKQTGEDCMEYTTDANKDIIRASYRRCPTCTRDVSVFDVTLLFLECHKKTWVLPLLK